MGIMDKNQCNQLHQLVYEHSMQLITKKQDVIFIILLCGFMIFWCIKIKFGKKRNKNSYDGMIMSI